MVLSSTYTLPLVFGCLSVISTGQAAYLGTMFACNHEIALFLGGDDTTEFCSAQIKCAVWKPGATLMMAKTKCLTEGLSELVDAKIKPADKTWFWLGATQTYRDKHWKWVDGTKLENGHTNWNSGEPNGNGYERCMEFHTSHKRWNDVYCSKKFGYVCQIEMAKASKSDHSQLLLSDYNSLPKERSLNYQGAQKVCANKGSRLAKISDKRSFVTFRRKVGKYTSHKYWIGASYRNGNWTWDNGDVVDFASWAPDNPSSNSAGKCIAATHEGWEDFDCNQTDFHFVCETATPHLLQVSDERPVVYQTKTLKVYCTSDGFPVPKVRWYRNDTLIASNGTSRVIQVIGEGRSLLMITNVEADDDGKYHCKASNTIDDVLETVMTFIDVKVVVDKDTDPKEIKGWKLERNEEFPKCQSSDAELTPLTTIIASANSGWVVPVVVILAILVCVLLVAAIIIARRRISFENGLNSGADKVTFSTNSEITASNAALHLK